MVFKSEKNKRNKGPNFRSPAMGNLPQRQGPSWNVHQVEGFYQVLNLVNIPTSAAEEGFP